MKIAVDAMGGDYAPLEVVKGVAEAASNDGTEILLVGKREVIEPLLMSHYPSGSNITLVNATEVISFEESPARAVRTKPNSSLVIGIDLLHQGKASAFVSAGSTGAVVAAAILILGKINDIERPALSILWPLAPSPTLFLDIGANADCKPSYLLGFARIGTFYMRKIHGTVSPRVGLLCTGEEKGKGNFLVRKAYRLLKESELNFVGNLEAKDLAKGMAEVIVTDGFTGNIVLKSVEGFGESLFDLLKQTVTSQPLSGEVASLGKIALQTLSKKVDYSEYGGALLLGVRGNVIIAHGRSRAKAIRNAIRLAKETAKQKVPATIGI